MKFVTGFPAACEAVQKPLLPDFHTRHPGARRGPAPLSDCCYGYRRKVLDSGFRRNEREAWPRATDWEVFIHSFIASDSRTLHSVLLARLD